MKLLIMRLMCVCSYPPLVAGALASSICNKKLKHEYAHSAVFICIEVCFLIYTSLLVAVITVTRDGPMKYIVVSFRIHTLRRVVVVVVYQ